MPQSAQRWHGLLGRGCWSYERMHFRCVEPPSLRHLVTAAPGNEHRQPLGKLDTHLPALPEFLSWGNI